MLPIRKWTDTTIRGKILGDIMDSIICQSAHELGKGVIYSMSSMIGKTQSLMCCLDSRDSTVYVDTPCKHVNEYYKGYDVAVPEQLNIEDYTAHIIGT